MDLYTVDFDSINEAGIEEFLGLGQPIQERPTEGLRFDFKQDFSKDFGAAVAAMANSYGGIIIIGVMPAQTGGSVSKNIPESLAGITGVELTQRALHLIRDSVQPVPVFKILERRLKGNPAKGVVVIRVEPGPYPPYMYLPGKKIQVRRGDGNESVTMLELESLLERRTRDGGMPRAARAPDIFALQHYPENRVGMSPPARCRNFFSVSLIPWDFGQVFLDLSLERRIAAHAGACFLRDSMLPLWEIKAKKTVRARLFEYAKWDYPKLIHRIWRVTNQGVIQFLTAIPYDEPEIIGNLFLDFLSTIKMGELFLLEHGYFGNVDVKVDLSSYDGKMEMKTPDIVIGQKRGNGTADVLGGVHGLDSPPKNRNTWQYYTTASFEQLRSPVDLTTAIFAENLRELWECEFNMDRLREQVAVFYADQFLSNLPKDARR